MRILLMLILAVLVQSAVVQAEPEGRKLLGPEIKQKLIGNTARIIAKNGSWLVVYYREDGKCFGRLEASARPPGTGSWTLSDDGKLCAEWSTQYLTSGCRTLYADPKTGAINAYNAEGTYFATYREITPGNPNDLH